MKDNLLEQCRSVRLVIGNTVGTIRSLFEQSQQLTNIVEQLGYSEANVETQNKLIKLNNDMLLSIKTLVSQTDQLFDQYDDFVKSVFE